MPRFVRVPASHLRKDIAEARAMKRVIAGRMRSGKKLIGAINRRMTGATKLVRAWERELDEGIRRDQRALRTGLLRPPRQLGAAPDEVDRLLQPLLHHLEFDVRQNLKHGYVPTAGVLAQREASRQAAYINEVAADVRPDFWFEWAPNKALVVGWRDNRDRMEYDRALRILVQRLGAPYRFIGVARPGDPRRLLLDVGRIGNVALRHQQWLNLMRAHGATVPSRFEG